MLNYSVVSLTLRRKCTYRGLLIQRLTEPSVILELDQLNFLGLNWRLLFTSCM
jgi:hypothetical protein